MDAYPGGLTRNTRRRCPGYDDDRMRMVALIDLNVTYVLVAKENSETSPTRLRQLLQVEAGKLEAGVSYFMGPENRVTLQVYIYHRF